MYMKFKKIILPVLTAASMLIYQSCNKVENFGNMNQNPNATTSPITAALLTNSLAGIGNNLAWDQGGISTVAGLYAQFFSETQYTEASRYAKPTFDFDGYYYGVLFDLQNIINYNSDPATAGIAAASGSNKNQIAVARILKAYYFFFITSMYGDIPYTQALKGGSGNNPYDAQQAIFTDLIKELKEAVDQFDNGIALKGDILFSGNIARWKKFANSARMLVALQMAKKDPATGKTEFLAALNHAAGYVSGNADNVVLNYPGGVYNHPGYQYYNITQRDDYAVSKTVTDQLNSTSDPRVSVFGTSNIGFPYGLTRDNAVAFANANPGFARIFAPSKRLANSSVVLIGAANITLARAEAAQRGWTTEVAATLYATGIQQSWDQWGVAYTPASLATYLALPAIALTPGTEMQKIATQEWLAWYPVGWQAFNVWRRTGFPVLTPAPGTTTGIPRRFPYGTREYQLNAANVQTAAAVYTVGGVSDSQYGKVWFDN
jgi:hypothetical protein